VHQLEPSAMLLHLDHELPPVTSVQLIQLARFGAVVQIPIASMMPVGLLGKIVQTGLECVVMDQPVLSTWTQRQ